ncbi:MAG: hypothetical protein U0W40_14425 [Acidimicrobiia bacterium]
MKIRRLLATCAAVVVGAISVSVTAGPASSGTFPGADGLIAFVRYEGVCAESAPGQGRTGEVHPSATCTGDIWTMTADGTNQVNLTNSPETDDGGPDWSADGKQIAYASGPVDQYHIWVMNADGSGKVEITAASTGSDTGPSWSPDGTKIAFMSYDGEFTTIWVVNSDGTGLHQLTTSANNTDWYQPAWSPDGTRLAVVQLFPGTTSLVTIDATTGAVIADLTPDLDNEGLGQPSWSPDGTKVAFRRYDPQVGFDDLWVTNSDGSGGAVDLTPTDTTADDTSPSWSPSGTRIAYERSDFPFGEIWLIGADGTQPTNLTNNPEAMDSNPAWQPIPQAKPAAQVVIVPAFTG